jgi:hypothetical protein
MSEQADQHLEWVQTATLAEYREAANAYFKGVDIGYTTIKGYVALNGLFVAVLGAFGDAKNSSLSFASDLVSLVPIFALVASAALLLMLPRYFMHLANCQHRCAELEKLFGGHLFTRLGAIAESRTTANTSLALLAVALAVASFWGYFLIRLWWPTFNVLKWFQQFWPG